MPKNIIRKTAYHTIPTSVVVLLQNDAELVKLWNELTDIQRNEWACYATTGVKSETREKHVKRMVNDLKNGKKTPCCWPGCPHRRPKAAKWFKDKAT